MVRTFKYTKTGVKGLVERTVIVLNEDETRIGGLDITGESPEKIAELTKQYENTAVKGFTRRPKGTPKETYASPYSYRAFSKAKIQQYN